MEPAASEATHRGRRLAAFSAAAAVTAPGLAARAGLYHPPHVAGCFVFGLAVVGAAFLLAWAAEALQLDVGQGAALAVLALIAVLPEYVVDFTFAAKAGTDPERYAPLALANMTGSNRLLIGIGWSMVVLVAAFRIRRTARRARYQGRVDTEVRLDRPHAIEIGFLTAATLYSFSLVLKPHIALYDAVVLVGLFVFYVVRISRSPAEQPELVGPAVLLGELGTRRRRVAVGTLLAFAGLTVLACAEPFADSLVATGEQLGIDTFTLVQWLAPLASEAPELVVAGLFAWRLNTNGGLGTLVSSKVNQWTLLVGTLPVVFVVAGGSSRGLPIDHLQREELFLTAAQSAFAVAVLASRSITVREAWALFGLFAAQFVFGAMLPESIHSWERIGFGCLYLVLAAGVLFGNAGAMRTLLRDGFRTPVRSMFHDQAGGTPPGRQAS